MLCLFLQELELSVFGKEGNEKNVSRQLFSRSYDISFSGEYWRFLLIVVDFQLLSKHKEHTEPWGWKYHVTVKTTKLQVIIYGIYF